jgi:hypothetical protein
MEYLRDDYALLLKTAEDVASGGVACVGGDRKSAGASLMPSLRFGHARAEDEE